MEAGIPTALAEALRPSWQRLAERTDATRQGAEAAFEDLVRHYSDPARHYHNLEHVASVLEWIDTLAEFAADPDLVRLAGWFHDVVYDPRRQDNEERSAAYGRAVLTSFGAGRSAVEEVERLVLLTKTHQARPADLNGQVLLDADLAILGATPEEYAAYARAIRREYAWVPDDGYCRGRRAVLEAFLQRPRVFSTARLAELREAAARSNLRAELRELGVPS